MLLLRCCLSFALFLFSRFFLNLSSLWAGVSSILDFLFLKRSFSCLSSVWASVSSAMDFLRLRLSFSVLSTFWAGVWFALRFNGTDSDFNLDTHERPEFSEWCWANLNDVTDLIVPFKRDVYMNVVNEFKDIPKKISNE